MQVGSSKARFAKSEGKNAKGLMVYFNQPSKNDENVNFLLEPVPHPGQHSLPGVLGEWGAVGGQIEVTSVSVGALKSSMKSFQA